MGRRTTIEQRELVMKHLQSGKSQRKIAEIVCLSSATVQNIIERFVNENRVQNKARCAPNKIFDERDERLIVRKIKENPMLSASKLLNEVQQEVGKSCCVETVRRVLREKDFNRRIARKSHS
ncbi:uncharacterized protein LOC128869773 [Anastrepha ludens]|uniref:uncharacterized protein LOC128869770 n=1 Tax=Anastrepha ludens TaxID=28586 RepID=UPI0023B1D1CA|nr:uncharacterized protein LOC128869770 [Anastrepha ludens]XP_053968353.1 uncharacterized protein LOC128869773 [Anastrepha ludens]